MPSARGCTYVVPACDFALALKAGEAFGDGEMKTAAKLGVTDKEIDKLCDAVLKALAKGPLDPDAIRDATGNASRNLGEEGKKKGLTTTLPLALGKLQVVGRYPPRAGKRPARSAALSLHAVAPESARRNSKCRRPR